MLGYKYIKATPTQFIIQFAGGKVKRAGPGLSFFYFRPASSIALVPLNSVDVPFIINEITKDFQAITVQGQLTYRINDPQLVASLLDYTVDVSTRQYRSEDPEKLAQRLVNQAQVFTRSEVQGLEMRAAIHASDRIANAVMTKFSESETLTSLGVEIITFAILAVKPTPDIARALEA